MRSNVSGLLVAAIVILLATPALAQNPTDYGDAPISYGEASALNISTDYYLGVCADSEQANLPSAGADGDDLDTGGFTVGTCVGDDDEDGITFDTNVVPGQMASITVSVGGQFACALFAWYDFNADGDFLDAGENIFSGLTVSPGANPLSFNVPADAVLAPSFARFRCCDDVGSSGCDSPTGTHALGEVEDHSILTVPVELQSFTAD
jgi:hypothetical protein